MAPKSKLTPPKGAKSGNSSRHASFRVAQASNGAATRREAPPPSNIPVAQAAIEPQIPWIDLRRFRQVMRVDRDLPLELGAEDRNIPIYPFTSGIQLTNDGVGFGEEIIESRVPSGIGKPTSARCQPLRFRRTRSGKVPFKGGEMSFLGPSGRDNT
jgi:hypothetical protein